MPVSRSACQTPRIGHHGTLTEPCVTCSRDLRTRANEALVDLDEAHPTVNLEIAVLGASRVVLVGRATHVP